MLQVFVENKVPVPSGSFTAPSKGAFFLAQHFKTEVGITYLLTWVVCTLG